MDNNNIEKIISETFNNPDVMSFIVQKVKDQIEKEQSSVEEKIIPDKTEQDPVSKKDLVKNILDNFEKKRIDRLKSVKIPKDVGMVIHKDLNDKANAYLNNNSLNDYIDNRDIFMNMFDKSIEDMKNTEDPITSLKNKFKEVEKKWDEFKADNNMDDIPVEQDPCEKCSNHCEYDCDYDFGTESCSHCESKDKCEEDKSMYSYTSYTTGVSQSTNEDGKPIGYLYFNFNSNNEKVDIFKQILNYYSILNLHVDEWDNWDHYQRDEKLNDSLSLLIDIYTYNFEDEERKAIDIDRTDDITSFIYTKLDDQLKMVSIYILNYHNKTNKLYDFMRFIITVPDEINEVDYNNYYVNLEKYFETAHFRGVLEDFQYTYIKHFNINNHLFTNVENEIYELIQKEIIKQIEIKFNSENQDSKQFLINAINDGFIKVSVVGPEQICLNINGTKVFIQNPYACNPRKDIFGNDKH